MLLRRVENDASNFVFLSLYTFRCTNNRLDISMHGRLAAYTVVVSSYLRLVSYTYIYYNIACIAVGVFSYLFKGLVFQSI
jgi:hypothetical protein